jgi:hypothetical protein
MMSPTEEFSIFVEVDEIDQKLLADGTDETIGMPTSIRSSTRRDNTNVTSIQMTGTLKIDKRINP